MAGSVGVPGWYRDPDGSGGQRYFDGNSWTHHRMPPAFAPPGYGWSPMPSWKGARIGRPHRGPGSLASPGRRLAARMLDGLVLLPVFAGLITLAVVLVAPHAGPILPRINTNTNTNETVSSPTPGLVWIYLAIAGALVFGGLAMVGYETIATVRFGRTLGKAWMRIRPLRLDGQALGWGRSLGRVGIYWLAGLLNWVGLLDPLWCLWDDNQQCLHDKVVDTIVINDANPSVSYQPSPPLVAAPSAPPWSAGDYPLPPAAGSPFATQAPTAPSPWPPYGYWGPRL
jgi:uncharacterized RDD family membrane protein YckC